MSKIAAGMVFAIAPGVILGVFLVLGGMRYELAGIIGGGLACIGFDVCMRGRKR